MHDTDRTALLESLEKSRDVFLGALADVSETAALYKTGDDRWSILDCVEHIAVAEERLFWLMTEKSSASDAPADPAHEEKIRNLAALRTRKLTAPEPVRPRGQFPSLQAAADRFVSNRERAIQYVKDCNEDLRRRTTAHPLVGQITCYECVLLLAAHPVRHAGQIAEIKAAPGFPQN